MLYTSTVSSKPLKTYCTSGWLVDTLPATAHQPREQQQCQVRSSSQGRQAEQRLTRGCMSGEGQTPASSGAQVACTNSYIPAAPCSSLKACSRKAAHHQGACLVKSRSYRQGSVWTNVQHRMLHTSPCATVSRHSSGGWLPEAARLGQPLSLTLMAVSGGMPSLLPEHSAAALCWRHTAAATSADPSSYTASGMPFPAICSRTSRHWKGTLRRAQWSPAESGQGLFGQVEDTRCLMLASWGKQCLPVASQKRMDAVCLVV